MPKIIWLWLTRQILQWYWRQIKKAERPPIDASHLMHLRIQADQVEEILAENGVYIMRPGETFAEFQQRRGLPKSWQP